MLVRELKRLLPFFGPLLVLLFIAVRLYDKALVPLPSFGDAAPKDSSSESKAPAKPAKPANPPKDGVHPAGYVEGAYQDLFSLSTPDKKYFKIVFDRKRSINPNAIPHPFLENTWIIVSQQQRSDLEKTVWFAELICNAVFKNNGELGCVEPPMILPISKTPVRSKNSVYLSKAMLTTLTGQRSVYRQPRVLFPQRWPTRCASFLWAIEPLCYVRINLEVHMFWPVGTGLQADDGLAL